MATECVDRSGPGHNLTAPSADARLTQNFPNEKAEAECYGVPGSANFTAAPASSGSCAFLSVAPSSSGAPAASGEAVLQ